MNLLQVAVIFGGCSPEYQVSLKSAEAVISNMDRTKFSPVMIGINPQGNWYLYKGPTERIAADTWEDTSFCTPVAVSPCRTGHSLMLLDNNKAITFPIDVVLPLLHGKNGEDGTVQGLFELAGIPIAGCSVLSSAICMDKERAHLLAAVAGVTVPRSFVLEQPMPPIETVLNQAEKLGYPLFVKPVKAGSSFGITKVADRCRLPDAIDAALCYDDTVIVEECISGFEVGCAVMGHRRLTVGAIDEIELSEGFFNTTEKYTLKTSAIHVPARISAATSDRIKQAAKLIFKTLDCRGFARVDFFLTTSGEIIFNEVNTIPGFTVHSRFPNMLKAAGWSFEQIITDIIERAVTDD